MNQNQTNILKMLQENARMSTADIARSLSLDENEVGADIKWLEDNGFILGYTALVNRNKLDQENGNVRALIEVRVRPEKQTGFQGLANRISQHDNVIEHYLISGNYDFLLVVEGKSLQEVSSFVSEQLACLENVISTTTHFIMRKYKEQGILIEKKDVLDRLVVS